MGLNGIRISSGADRYTAGEVDVVLGTVASWAGARVPVVYCHGSGDTAYTALGKTGQYPLLRALAGKFTVGVGDLALQASWGNDLGRTRVEEMADYLEAEWNAPGPVILVSGSMGTLNALGFALEHPERVLAVASIIPALDLADLMIRGAAADINAAYGGAYNDAVHGPDYSPVQYAEALDPDLPIHLFTCSDDTITVPATAAAFVAARPQTTRYDLGALGHSEAAVAAAIAPVMAVLDPLTWGA